jgi:hypothetical protein
VNTGEQANDHRKHQLTDGVRVLAPHRPYTLVLTKTDELFTREKDARHKAVTDLVWLASAWGDGPPGTF